MRTSKLTARVESYASRTAWHVVQRDHGGSVAAWAAIRRRALWWTWSGVACGVLVPGEPDLVLRPGLSREDAVAAIRAYVQLTHKPEEPEIDPAVTLW